MEWPKTKEEVRALALTILINLILVLIFLLVGLTYYDPKPEEGIAIRFGYNADAGGPIQEVENPEQQQRASAPPVKSSQSVINTPVQDVEDAPAVTTKKENKQDNNKRRDEMPKPTEEPQPQIDQRLKNILNNPDRGSGGKSGSGSQQGVQGAPTGSGQSGSSAGEGEGVGSSGTGYFLGGRQAIVRPKPEYNCAESGRVVVRIKVDQSGNVFEAEPGVSFREYSTNVYSECLYRRAREAALRTKWSADSDAPEDGQVGFIIYDFQKK